MILMVKVRFRYRSKSWYSYKCWLALLLQELGHFFGTIVFGFTCSFISWYAFEAVGACYSVDREPNVAVIIDKFGFSSPEGRGVMGMYICGVLIGAMWSSVLAGMLATIWLVPSIGIGYGRWRR